MTGLRGLITVAGAATIAGCADQAARDAEALASWREQGLPVPAGLERSDPLVIELVASRLRDVSERPRAGEPWFELARALQGNGFLHEAEIAHETVLTLDSAHAAASYLLAVLQQRRGASESAIASARRAGEIEPGYAPAHWRAGMWSVDAGHLDAAAAYFDSSIAADPAAEAGWFGRARVHLARNELEPAIELIEGKLIRGSNAGYARQLLATAYRRAGRPDQAKEQLSRAVTAIPNWEDPWLDSVEELRTGYLGEIARAERLTEVQNYEEAIAVLERLDEMWPESVTIYTNLAIAHDELGRPEKALEILNESLRFAPDHYLPNLNIGTVLAEEAKRGKAVHQVALSHLRRAVELNPANARAHAMLGSFLIDLGRLEEAIESFRKVLLIDPYDMSALHRLGTVHARRGEWSEAARAFERILEFDPDAAVVWGSLASVRINLAQPGLAQAALDSAARQLSREHPQIITLQRQIDAMVATPGSDPRGR